MNWLSGKNKSTQAMVRRRESQVLMDTAAGGLGAGMGRDAADGLTNVLLCSSTGRRVSPSVFPQCKILVKSAEENKMLQRLT